MHSDTSLLYDSYRIRKLRMNLKICQPSLSRLCNGNNDCRQQRQLFLIIYQIKLYRSRLLGDTHYLISKIQANFIIKVMLVNRIPKSGQLQKGQYLSLQFFQHYIAKNLADVRRRIRDVIDLESKKKGKKLEAQKIQEYVKIYLQFHTLSHQTNKILEINSKGDVGLEIINPKFISQYPLFYRPKRKIWIRGDEDIHTLAILNHFAFGYYYEVDEEGDLNCLLSHIDGDYFLHHQRYPQEF